MLLTSLCFSEDPCEPILSGTVDERLYIEPFDPDPLSTNIRNRLLQDGSVKKRIIPLSSSESGNTAGQTRLVIVEKRSEDRSQNTILLYQAYVDDGGKLYPVFGKPQPKKGTSDFPDSTPWLFVYREALSYLPCKFFNRETGEEISPLAILTGTGRIMGIYRGEDGIYFFTVPIKKHVSLPKNLPSFLSRHIADPTRRIPVAFQRSSLYRFLATDGVLLELDYDKLLYPRDPDAPSLKDQNDFYWISRSLDPNIHSLLYKKRPK